MIRAEVKWVWQWKEDKSQRGQDQGKYEMISQKHTIGKATWSRGEENSQQSMGCAHFSCHVK